MNKIYRSNAKATICADKVCVTVYDKMAEFINAMVVITVSIVALAVIVKALK